MDTEGLMGLGEKDKEIFRTWKILGFGLQGKMVDGGYFRQQE